MHMYFKIPPRFDHQTQKVIASTHRALLAVPARVLAVLRLCALALAAHALAVPRAQLAHVLAVLRHARLVRRAALARRVACGEGKIWMVRSRGRGFLYCLVARIQQHQLQSQN